MNRSDIPTALLERVETLLHQEEIGEQAILHIFALWNVVIDGKPDAEKFDLIVRGADLADEYVFGPLAGGVN